MSPDMNDLNSVTIKGARENNLRNITVSFPKNKLVVVTGVSGSGKSSLIFDILYREAERRYLGSFSSLARQFLGKMHKPDVDDIEGIAPAVALDQKSVVRNPRSTVGTITGIYDLLRLLFARCGSISPGFPEVKPTRSLFSFNTPEGACPACKGLGAEDFLDPAMLIKDENLSLREGALVITAPNGYIIYSQVTLDVLDQVCRAEGFHIDIPWKELSPEQKHIVLYGSNKIEIPFGKHPLESRMKWSGITAKPRELGFYKGILPVMEDILRRDRNKNILRFVKTITCRTCGGTRLNPAALSVRFGGKNIAEIAELQLNELESWLDTIQLTGTNEEVALPVIHQIRRQIKVLTNLGLGYLTSARESTTLSGGESQRLRLATIASMELSNMIFIFDEPSIGLHPYDTGKLIDILESLRDRGNTVIVVEHEEEFIRRADWLIDVGPGPGRHGGEIICNLPAENMGNIPGNILAESRTLSFLTGRESIPVPNKKVNSGNSVIFRGASANNLKHIDFEIKLNALNVVTGISGAGKSSLAAGVVDAFFEKALNGKMFAGLPLDNVQGYEPVKKVIHIDQSPIGKTSRSNPATYTGLFDHIRELFAAQPLAIEMGFDKSRFSFNTEGGRCETCEGAGYQKIGMHFMENAEAPCETCEGKRFDNPTLLIRYKEKDISGILEMTVEEALSFFENEPVVLRYLHALQTLGLGYLELGQRSSTLSGGEAQRIKLAAELSKPESGHTLYILDEPTTGLHHADVGKLLNALNDLILKGHTMLVVEHHPGFIRAADHIIDLGPGSGKEGGNVVFSGTPADLLLSESSLTGKYLRDPGNMVKIDSRQTAITEHNIIIKNAGTHNLRNLSLEIPKNKLVTITGVSGSGKSSLAFDTLHAEAQRRFLDGFSPYLRSKIGLPEKADFEYINGLTPTLAVDQSAGKPNPRSTVGTFTGIYDFYRLLFSRLAKNSGDKDTGTDTPLSSLFSFNHQSGACPVCKGLGIMTVCDPDKLITHPGKSILSGAMDGTKTGKFYGDPDGQYVAFIRAAGKINGIDFSPPWNQLAPWEKEIVLNGTGAEIPDVVWQYKRGKRQGEHHFSGTWKGLIALVEEEYLRKHADHRGESMLNVMSVKHCPDCEGKRLNREALTWTISGMDIAVLSDLPVEDSIPLFRNLPELFSNPAEKKAASGICHEILNRLTVISGLGLDYLSVSRSVSTLSSGELRRIRLVSQLISGLTGITCILDEPTAGLHPKDTARLIHLLKKLRDDGNTVILAEHNRDVILASDHIIDLGPEGGINGGRLVVSGTPDEIRSHPASLTGKYLDTGVCFSNQEKRKLKEGLRISRAYSHNLKEFDVHIPSGGIIVVTGVSGSGKSSLVFDLIYRSYLENRSTGCDKITGFQYFTKVIPVLSAASATRQPVLASLHQALFSLFASLPAARNAGLNRKHFDFSDSSGQCPQCLGTGKIITPMDFLPDVTTVCPVCRGKRFRDVVLEVTLHGKTVSDALEMTFGELLYHFRESESLTGIAESLVEAGLGYLRAGQDPVTFSGGESRRMFMVSELMCPSAGPSLYLFDEPSAGLHFHDADRLMKLFGKLADQGHTLLVIEHNPSIIALADFHIELGPKGGNRGGYLVKPGDSFSVIILAAGLSKRMGMPKALLPFNQSSTFLEKIITEYANAGCRRIVCVVNQEIMPHCAKIEKTVDVKFILNEHPERGRLHSIQLGMKELPDNSYCFIQNVDNPFIDAGVIGEIQEAADENRWISPEFNGKPGHPVLLPHNCREAVLQVKNMDVCLKDILVRLPVKRVELKTDSVLMNINSREDFLRQFGQ